MEPKKSIDVIPRDVSWMYFNYRILQEAQNTSVPLLERLGFMGIYSNNLDEFFRVRMATLTRIAESDVKQMKSQIEEARHTIKVINKLNNRYNKEFGHVVGQLTKELEKEKIRLVNEKQLNEAQQSFIRQYFRNSLAGFTNPIWLSQAERLANESDDTIYLAVKLTRWYDEAKKPKKEYALIRGPYNAESSADLLNALGGQPYPGTEGNIALTNETTPASLVFTGTWMNKPITQIRELENGDIVLKYKPKGRLEAPVVETAVEVASNSFKFSWSPSENATFYTVKVYGISGDEQWTEHPVFVADSLSETCCTVRLDDTGYQSYAYGVSALDDEYEDSEFSGYGYVQLPADAVRQVNAKDGANVEVYSLHGVLLARSREEMLNLNPGIYILRTEDKAVKIVVK